MVTNEFNFEWKPETIGRKRELLLLKQRVRESYFYSNRELERVTSTQTGFEFAANTVAIRKRLMKDSLGESSPRRVPLFKKRHV